MDLSKRNKIADKFLLIMKQALDEQPRIPYFDFRYKGTGEYQGRPVSMNPEGKYLTQLKEQIEFSDEEFSKVINYCFSQKYIWGGSLQYIRLSDKGMQRANEIENLIIQNTAVVIPETAESDNQTNTNKFDVTEKKILEKFFEMESGYVLDFSNRTFEEFFNDTFGINIYDEKYNYNSGSKANRLRAFWDIESNIMVSECIIKMIEWWETTNLINGKTPKENQKELASRCKIIAANIRTRQTSNNPNDKDNAEELAFLNKKIGSIDIKSIPISGKMSDIIQQRLNEIEVCLKSKVALGTIFLIGSTLEGILIDLAKQHPAQFNKANSAPKNIEGKVKPFNAWSLSSLIDVSYETGFIGLDVKKFSHNLRDFRNYIHPEEQLKQNFTPDLYTTSISWQVLLAAIKDITENNIPSPSHC